MDQSYQALQDRLALLEAEVAVLRTPRRRGPARAWRLVRALALVALLAVVPGTLLAADFGDLNAGSPHNDNIAAIAAAGITKGCNPPDYTNYCPNDLVTREQMASFLARTAGLGSNPPVANAATLGGYPAASLARVSRGAGTLYPVELSLNGAYQTIAQVTITAPGPGFVLVNGTAVVYTDNSGCGCGINLRLRDGAGAVSPYTNGYVGTAANSTLAQTLAPTWVFPVSAAGAQTFVIEAQQYIGAPQAKTSNGALTALFVPFGSTGGNTLDIL